MRCGNLLTPVSSDEGVEAGLYLACCGYSHIHPHSQTQITLADVRDVATPSLCDTLESLSGRCWHLQASVPEVEIWQLHLRRSACGNENA